MHSHHGSGAVIVSSRKTGFVNFGVSRESGGAVRAPRNAGDKRVKRKRGNRSVAAGRSSDRARILETHRG